MMTLLIGTLLLVFFAPLLWTVALWLICAYVELFWWLLMLPWRLAGQAWGLVASAWRGNS